MSEFRNFAVDTSTKVDVATKKARLATLEEEIVAGDGKVRALFLATEKNNAELAPLRAGFKLHVVDPKYYDQVAKMIALERQDGADDRDLGIQDQKNVDNQSEYCLLKAEIDDMEAATAAAAAPSSATPWGKPRKLKSTSFAFNFASPSSGAPPSNFTNSTGGFTGGFVGGSGGTPSSSGFGSGGVASFGGGAPSTSSSGSNPVFGVGANSTNSTGGVSGLSGRGTPSSSGFGGGGGGVASFGGGFASSNGGLGGSAASGANNATPPVPEVNVPAGGGTGGGFADDFSIMCSVHATPAACFGGETHIDTVRDGVGARTLSAIQAMPGSECGEKLKALKKGEFELNENHYYPINQSGGGISYTGTKANKQAKMKWFLYDGPVQREAYNQEVSNGVRSWGHFFPVPIEDRHQPPA